MTTALEALGELDPDDSRQSSQQIADRLRAAILDRRFAPGDRIPSQPELANHFGVARETVKRALDLLRVERLIVSRQGSGVFVRTQMAMPVELRPHIESAFERADVRIDFAGLSAETLRDALSEVLDKVRVGEYAPQSIRIRILVADPSEPMLVPVIAQDLADDERLRKRLKRIIQRSTGALVDQAEELGELGIVGDVEVQVRELKNTPMTKMYLINGESCFFGYYPVAPRTLKIDGEQIQMMDMLGRDVPLLLFTKSDDDSDSCTQFVHAATQWFESVWSLIAQEADK